MTTLLNRFMLCGELTEIHIELFPTHTKCKMGVKVNEAVYTVYYNFGHKWHEDKYNELMWLIPQLHGAIDGNVMVDNEIYYKMKHGESTRLFISGNISCRGDRTYLNAAYMSKTNSTADSIHIDIKAAYLGDNKWLNVVSDAPRIFNVSDNGHSIIHDVYKLGIEFVPEYRVDDGVIMPIEKSNEWRVTSIEKSKERLNEKDIVNWLVEWRIINGE